MGAIYIVAWLTLAFVLPAMAQKTIPYIDKKTGETLGTATISGNNTYIRKSDGELIGSIVTAPDGSRTLYDPSGNIIDSDHAPAGKPNAK